MKKNIYIFSGLGADKRVFYKLDLTSYNVFFIDWILPDDKETIEKYANRIIRQINHTKPILVGLSFGGIVAIEVAKLIKTEKVLIISSAKNKYEIPIYYRFLGKIGITRILPINIFKKTNFITHLIFGAKNLEDRELLDRIILETNPKFLRWALVEISNWQNKIEIENLYHIHGTNDIILPVKFINEAFKIEGGGHLIIITKSNEIEIILKNIIAF